MASSSVSSFDSEHGTKEDSTSAAIEHSEIDIEHSEECIKKAVVLLDVNDIDGAIAVLHESLKFCSISVAALLLLRVVYMSDPTRIAADGDSENTPDMLQKRVDEAPDTMYARTEALLSHDESHGTCWSVLRGVWLAYILGKHKEAFKCYKEVIDIPTDDWSSNLIRSAAFTNAAVCIERLSQQQQNGKTPSDLNELFPDGKKSAEEALRTWYRIAAEHGNRTAKMNYALLELNGTWGVSEDKNNAAKALKEVAESGLAPAQVFYAWCIQTGTGCDHSDLNEAASWIQRAAEQHHAPAMRKFGELLRDGRGVARDDKQAVHWLELAAKRGDAQAQFDLALMYQSGRGVAEQDDYEAAVLLHLAAEQHLPRAMHCLATCYTQGRGVPRNAKTAAVLFIEAAESGLSESQTSAGLCFMNGYGVEKNVEKANEWFVKAAAQNELNALRILSAQKP